MARLYQLIKLKSDLSIVISIYFCSIYWPQWYLIQLLIFGVVFLVYVVIYLKICEERHSSSHTMIPSKLLLSTRCISHVYVWQFWQRESRILFLLFSILSCSRSLLLLTLITDESQAAKKTRGTFRWVGSLSKLSALSEMGQSPSLFAPNHRHISI